MSGAALGERVEHVSHPPPPGATRMSDSPEPLRTWPVCSVGMTSPRPRPSLGRPVSGGAKAETAVGELPAVSRATRATTSSRDDPARRIVPLSILCDGRQFKCNDGQLILPLVTRDAKPKPPVRAHCLPAMIGYSISPDLARRDLHNVDGVADHVGRVFLALGPLGMSRSTVAIAEKVHGERGKRADDCPNPDPCLDRPMANGGPSRRRASLTLQMQGLLITTWRRL
jgi:hypothetical protein